MESLSSCTWGRCAVWSDGASVYSFVWAETSISPGRRPDSALFPLFPTGPDARFLAGRQRGRFYLLQSGRSAPDEARSDGRTRAPCPCQTARVKKMPLLLSRAIFFFACHSLRLVTLVCRLVVCCCITMQIYQHMNIKPAAAVRKIVGLGQEMTFQ